MLGAHEQGFAAVRDRYVRFALDRNPAISTFLGGDGWDPVLAECNARLRDARPAAIADEISAYRGMQQELAAMDRASLPSPDRIDAALLDAHLAFVLHQLSELRHHERAVDTYVGEPFRSVDWQIQQMRPQPGEPGTVGTDEEWRRVAARVRSIPAYLEVALQNLQAGIESGNAPDARMVERDGRGGSAANAGYFSVSLPSLAAANLYGAPRRARILEDVVAAAATAGDAFRKLASDLLGLRGPGEDRFAVGEAEWEWRVHNNLREPRSAQEIWDYAGREVESYRDRLLSVAGELSTKFSLGARFSTPEERATGVAAVLAALGRDAAVDDDERLAWHVDVGRRAVDYGRRHSLFDVGEDYELDVVPTPPLLRETVEAAYYPAAPLKPGGVGRFYLTPTGNDPAVLAQNPRGSVATIAVHEGFPGHDWHYRTMAARGPEISPLRWLTPGAVEDSSSMWSDSMSIEGWGLYAEDLMHTGAGAGDYGFYSLEEEFYFLYWNLRRAMRVRVDTGLHTGRMHYDEAVDWWAATQDFMPDARARSRSEPAARAVIESADRNIYRYSKWVTQGITYNLGKQSIVALRDRYRALHPANPARAFHEWYLGLGAIPAGYLFDALEGEAQPGAPASG